MKYLSLFILFSFFASISSVRSDNCAYEEGLCKRFENLYKSNPCYDRQLIKNKFECTIRGGNCCALHECVDDAKRDDKDNNCKCKENRYQLGNICKECPLGYYSKYGAKADTECYRNCIKDDVLNCAKIDETNPGTIYYPANTKQNECSCSKCMKGYYKNNNKCKQCPYGFRDGEGVDSINECVANVPAGKYLTKDGYLYVCPPGYYCKNENSGVKYSDKDNAEENTKKACNTTGYPNSDSGAKSETDCYTSCEKEKVIEQCKTYLKDKYYVNDTKEINKCECSECEQYYLLKSKKTCEWRISCDPGEFLPKNTKNCITCSETKIESMGLSEQEKKDMKDKIKNSYCTGGYFIQQPYDQGIENCPDINVEDHLGTYFIKESAHPRDFKGSCYVKYYSYNDHGCIQKYKKKYNKDKIEEISEQCVNSSSNILDIDGSKNKGEISCYLDLKNKKCISCEENSYFNRNNCSNCPVGMKSKKGSSSINDCKYTKDTKFCFDNTKCFTIEELGDLDSENGKYDSNWKVVY